MELYDVAAERELFGAMILYTREASKVTPWLRRDDFTGPRHGDIYSAIVDTLVPGEPLALVTVMARLRDAYGWHSSDSHDFVDAVSHSGMLHNVKGHAKLIEGYSRRRKAIELAGRAASQAESGAFEDLVVTGTRVVEEASPRGVGEETVRLGERMIESPEEFIGNWEKAHEVLGVPTGIPSLDRLTMGYQAGNLVIIAARPGVGKTGFAVHAAISAASVGVGTLFVTLEMTPKEIHSRLSAHVSGLDSRVLIRGDLHGDTLDRAISSQALVAGLPIYVSDVLRGPAEIQAEATRLSSKVGLVIVDYLGLMESTGRFGTREQEVAWLSRNCKRMASELKKPVLLLSQLSRTEKGQAGRRPILSDLRDSGAIEADANLVIFLHDLGALSGNAGEAEHVELIIAKQRSGPTGTVDVRYRRDTGHFTQWTGV